MIRADHTRVLAAFHRYRLDAPPRKKQGIVNSICLALEVHAEVEEEVFYPALRAADSSLVDEQLVPEHEEMRRLIASLRAMAPRGGEIGEQYDATFMELMRAVMHHVADEETILLTHAESVMGTSLMTLGRQMAVRRMRLKATRTPAMVGNAARAAPGTSLVMTAGAVLAGALLFRRFRRHA
jgi:hypothetical protein